MTLTLQVDEQRWHSHLKSFLTEHRGVVPVVKGNGYGFGRELLSDTVHYLGLRTLAVGTYAEIDSVQSGRYSGDVLVLSPWRPFVQPVAGKPKVIHTVSRLVDLESLVGSGERVVVELLTSMNRHGIPIDDIPEAIALLDKVKFEGWAMHLPMEGDTFEEARVLAAAVAGTATHHGDRLWVSHLTSDEAIKLSEMTRTEVRLRAGTGLWLGDRKSLQARALVLDSHSLARGTPAGYRGRRAPSDGTLLIVGAGTAHGVALEAPANMSGARQRGAALAKGGLAATGRAMSPFRVGGKQRWFFEPPHMQVSMIWLPGDTHAPEIGDTIPLDVRYTTTLFDEVELVN